MPPTQQTYSIQEVSEKLNITKHTLRFWEKKLHGVFVPHRTRGGQRRYTREHITLIGEIIRLKNEGMSLRDIRQKLSGENEINIAELVNGSIDTVADQIAEVVRSAVYRFLLDEYSDKQIS